ncbi:MAG: APC family permease, partial [Conexibacteraceae bacterium]|nr:APC family permease [Conexibacteraceae bacterium]
MDSEPHGTIGIRALFGVVYATSISSIYFALGVVATHANGLTPEVFVVAGVFFLLTGMTYAEGASVHPERGGSAVFARYAFNELVSFIAGWAIVLDYTILIAVAALTAPAYLSVFWPTLDHGIGQVLAAIVVISLIAFDGLRGITGRRLRRRAFVTVIDLSLQTAVFVLGVFLVFHPSHLTEAVHLGTAPSAADLAFALPIGVIAFAGIEAAASVSAEVSATPRQLKRLVGLGGSAIVAVYVAIAVIGIATLPVHDGVTQLGQRHLNAPLLEIVESYRPTWVADILKYVVGVIGATALTAAAGAAMLGVSRNGFSLATNRQIPSGLGRLSSRWGTPWVVIGGAALAAAGLVIPANLEVLIGIYAFGALIAFTIAHLSVIATRFREPDRERSFRVPWSVSVRGASVPLPAVAGVVLGTAGWVALIIYHHAARYVGLGWMLAGLALYVTYRRVEGKPLLRRVTIPERALRHEAAEPEFGSILVPLFGTPLDDDII